MRPLHCFFAILVAAIWGSNFIFIQLALNEMPAFLLCALRFSLACVPAIFFIKKPNIPFRLLALYGIATFALQFILLFAGMQAGMPSGLTSLVIQIQMFFSILFAAIFLNEKPNNMQILGGIIALAGIGLVCFKMEATMSMVGLILVIAAAASWGLGNVISKKIGKVNVIALIAWGCFVASPLLILFSFFIDGPDKIAHCLKNISLIAEGSVLYIVYISTWLGYGLWNWLLNKYPVSSVIPFSLLVPVFGMLTSMVIFHEPLQPWKMTAAIFIIVGLIINTFGPFLIRYSRQRIESV